MLRMLSPIAPLSVALLCTACSKPAEQLVKATSYDTETVVSSLMSRCDANGDGDLERSEVDKCLALKHAFNFYDKNKDGRISREELSARLNQHSGVTVPLGCQVNVAGQPAKGCKIIFTPDESFPHLKPASGTTDATGFAKIQVDGVSSPGVPAGLYNVLITDESGKELFKSPAGREVFDDGRDNRDLIIFSF